jgi:hypothetical protein
VIDCKLVQRTAHQVERGTVKLLVALVLLSSCRLEYCAVKSSTSVRAGLVDGESAKRPVTVDMMSARREGKVQGTCLLPQEQPALLKDLSIICYVYHQVPETSSIQHCLLIERVENMFRNEQNQAT